MKVLDVVAVTEINTKIKLVFGDDDCNVIEIITPLQITGKENWLKYEVDSVFVRSDMLGLIIYDRN